ncbi:response regulator [Agaribacter flavus]|uniref:Response regulator n=1 Tax=Agaribacter flavus TaxID=1902781 RepID=A0ABV7FUV0_9ALTE
MSNKETTDKLKRINILVVDDMESMVNLVKSCLLSLGAEKITTATNGANAWSILNKKDIDLIICDWDMPKMTGFGLLKLVRESEMHKHIPFLLLTAAREKKLVMDALEAGVSDYLAKPFQPKELSFRVVKLLRKIP